MTREEAINEIKSWDFLERKEIEAIHTLIPELAESEDERIRKVIYKLMLGMRKEIFTSQDEIVTKEKVLAYLEKQKDCILVPKSHLDPVGEPGVDGMKILEKQKEQKKEPVEHWQYVGEVGLEENKDEKKANIELIQKSWYMEGYHDREYNKEPKWIIKTGEGGPKYEDNPKYGQLIKKKFSEWSEEDEGMLNCIIATLCEEEHGGRETNNKMVTWLDNRLKSLHPVKQEWSEEDEEHLKSIISTIEMCMMDCEDAKAVLGYYESDISWLKSLRPHWKPSEEQMKALWDAYKGGKEQEPLRELIEQLKKL